MHKQYDSENHFVGLERFQLTEEESEGTKKIVALLGPIVDALNKGQILVVDELDAKLHPLITRFIIRLFHSTEFNKKNAQLVFNSHDTNLLSKAFFRRDKFGSRRRIHMARQTCMHCLTLVYAKMQAMKKIICMENMDPFPTSELLISWVRMEPIDDS
ncbi:abortive infection protein [Sporolactobacillus inulinus]|uniref:Abortive infection protein n=2 Tax=Sporolactobacillus inulinus TaxID=2078 RepID=A0A4Y1ZBF3_9BACL|nr:abortive infection protein [Sporolactobacillus inulinus]